MDKFTIKKTQSQVMPEKHGQEIIFSSQSRQIVHLLLDELDRKNAELAHLKVEYDRLNRLIERMSGKCESHYYAAGAIQIEKSNLSNAHFLSISQHEKEEL